MLAVLRRVRNAWRRSGEARDENVVENARVAHDEGDRAKHGADPDLPTEQKGKFWMWFPPG